MAKQKQLQSSFSSGELSPQALGRSDIARYPAACKRMVNVVCRTLGGAKKRYGTEYIKPAKFNDKRARVIPYIVNRDTAYVLELGDLYMRVFKTDGTQVMSGLSPYEVVTPYNESRAQELDYAQDETQMFAFQNGIYPHRIRTFGDALWDVSEAPFTTTPFAEVGDTFAVSLTLSSNTVGTGRTMTASAGVFLQADVGRAISRNAGIFIITAYTSATEVTGEVKIIFESASIAASEWTLDSSPQASLTPSVAGPQGASATMTLASAGFRSTDVGKFIRINEGLVKVTGFTSSTQVSATVIKELSSATAAPALAWTLEGSVWGGVNGYPRSGCLHEQRLIAAGTITKPQTIWGSRSGEPLDFTIGTQDDDGFAFTIAGANSQTNQIAYVHSARNLLALTNGGEYSLQSGVEKPLAPTNVQIRAQSPYGAAPVKPVQIGRETMYVQRALRKLRAMSFKFDQDGYSSPDITTLAEHLTESGVCCMAFQQEPDPVLWVVLLNGKMVSVTVDRDVDVLAWTQHETDGAFESVCVVPAGDHEQVWLIVRRTINGSTVRYVERMQQNWFPLYGTSDIDEDAIPPDEAEFSWGFTLDCAATQDDAAGKTTWTGAGHLEGKQIRCIADGVDMPAMTIAGGSFTLPRAAKRVLYGIMFKPTIVQLTPDIQGGGSSIQTNAISVHEIAVRFYKTVGCTIDGDILLHGRINGPDQLDRAPELFSGDERISKLGWDRGKSEITISQDDPFPFHVLSVIRSMSINEG